VISSQSRLTPWSQQDDEAWSELEHWEADVRSTLWIALFIGFVAGPASGQVTLDQWGTYAVTASSDCADFCDPETDFSWFLGLTFGPTNGAAAVDVIDSTLDNARGDAFAEASVQVEFDPVVRVDANALPGGWMDGTGTAVQGYTYLGLVANTIDVNVQLTGTIGNPDGDPSTGLAAQVSYVGDANVASLVFENAVQGLLTPDGAVQLEQTTDGPVALADTLSIPVSPGDQFYLVASSAATAGGTGAFAQSLGTLSITFTPADAANLQAASASASLPASSWPAALVLAVALLAAGLAFVGSRTELRRVD
jgi:hypothetical protein